MIYHIGGVNIFRGNSPAETRRLGLDQTYCPPCICFEIRLQVGIVKGPKSLQVGPFYGLKGVYQVFLI